MMTSVLGALAGGAIFQWLFGFNFSVAVQVGYIACFGMAVETGVVMLVYLHEAIDERGGLERIGSIAELRQAILEGAIHRLRPKLLTEGAAIISIAPMLWATGVGAEVIRPMAAPVLGGLLIADEVIDVFLPVLYFAVCKAALGQGSWCAVLARTGRNAGFNGASFDDVRRDPLALHGTLRQLSKKASSPISFCTWHFEPCNKRAGTHPVPGGERPWRGNFRLTSCRPRSTRRCQFAVRRTATPP